jgi:hypothetical protein
MNGDTTRRIKAIIRQKYDTFVRLHIHHVYLCKTCNRCFASKNLKKVIKDEKEKRVCPICEKDVDDVTFTPLGESWRALVRPDLEIG